MYMHERFDLALDTTKSNMPPDTFNFQISKKIKAMLTG